MLVVKSFRQCWNLEREKEEDGIKAEEFQLFSTSVEKEGSISLICSNLKGLVNLRVGGSESNNIGQWSDLVRGR